METLRLYFIELALCLPFIWFNQKFSVQIGFLADILREIYAKNKNIYHFKISDLGFIEELVDDLKEIFQIDKDFSEKKFEKQMAVVRGQALNLASAMR